METYDNSMAPRFRAILLQRALQLGASLDHELAAVHGETGRDVADFKDFAAEQAVAEVEEVQAEHAAAELGQIRAALARIADGTYGECPDCGDPIDLRRLAALPAAPLCAGCQEAHERQRA